MKRGTAKVGPCRRKHPARRLTAVVVSFALAGCQTMPTMPGSSGATAGQTEDEIAMYQQAKTFNQTVMEGCMVGIAAGALLGAFLNRNNRAKGALIGGTAGGALGCGSAIWLAKAQQQHALTEQELDGMITDLQTRNASLNSLVVSAKKVIKADKAKIARIDKDVGAGRMSMEEARTEMSSVDRNRNQLETTISNLRNEQTKWQQTAQAVRNQSDKGKVRRIDSEISQLEKQVNVLESDLDALIKRRQLSRVG